MKCVHCGTKVSASKELAETPGAQACCANCRTLSNYYQTERRCLVTKNICGTDTWMKGRPCKCEECQAYLCEYNDWLHRKMAKLRGEVLVVSENPMVVEHLTLHNIALKKEIEKLHGVIRYLREEIHKAATPGNDSDRILAKVMNETMGVVDMRKKS